MSMGGGGRPMNQAGRGQGFQMPQRGMQQMGRNPMPGGLGSLMGGFRPSQNMQQAPQNPAGRGGFQMPQGNPMMGPQGQPQNPLAAPQTPQMPQGGLLSGNAWDVLSQGDFQGPSGERDLDLSNWSKAGHGGLMVSPITMGNDVTAARQAQMWIEDAQGQRVGGQDHVWGRPVSFDLKNLDPNGKYKVKWTNAGPNGIRAQGRGR
jgi:hypothetical protein